MKRRTWHKSIKVIHERIQRTDWRRLAKHTAQRISLIAVLLTMAVYGIGASYAARNKQKPVDLGFSFSTKYAKELGVDWRQALPTLLSDLNVSTLRLMSYWDLHEPYDDGYNFTSLDEQMDLAAQHGVNVTLSIGQRQPRWPECHIPHWAQKLPRETYQEELLEYLEVVVERYREHPALESYQLENEAANRHFGVCHEFDPVFMQQEAELVRSLDQNNELWTNASNQSGIPLREPTGEKIGFSVYKQAFFPLFNYDVQWNFWYVPSWWHGFRAAVSEAVNDAPSFVHELQAEPWGYRETVYLTDEEQTASMDPDTLRRNVDFALQSGMTELHLWGAEWWYWRLTEYDDQELWNTVKSIYARNGYVAPELY